MKQNKISKPEYISTKGNDHFCLHHSSSEWLKSQKHCCLPKNVLGCPVNKNCYCFLGKETVYLQATSEPRFVFVFIEKTWANLFLCIKLSDLYWNNTTVIQRTQGWIKGNFLFANIHMGSHMCNFLGVSQKECLLSSWPSQESAELCFLKSLMSG